MKHAISTTHQQRGITLAIVLIMLLIVTVLGVASIRGATTQERMVGNFYDRTLAMQAAESALREAFSAVSASKNAPAGTIDCTSLTNTNKAQCAAIPTNTFTSTSADWRSATKINNALPNGNITKDLSTNSAPQYLIQKIAVKASGGGASALASSDDDSFDLGTGDRNQGKSGGGSNVYRIIARSHNPSDANDESRSLVVLTGIAR